MRILWCRVCQLYFEGDEDSGSIYTSTCEVCAQALRARRLRIAALLVLALAALVIELLIVALARH